MSQLNVFRDFLNERLATSALEIFAAAEKLFAEYEGEISRSKEDSKRLQRLLDIVTQPEIKFHQTGLIDNYIYITFSRCSYPERTGTFPRGKSDLIFAAAIC